MVNTDLTIIFSHGFGIRKDNLGLFTFLSEKFRSQGYGTVLFDYYNYDEKTKEIDTIPFSKQAQILQSQIDDAKKKSTGTKIVVIGHSQGSIIPAFCNVSNVNKVIGISPFFLTDEKEVMARYSARKGSITDFKSISKRLHSNGEVTVIYPEYWEERFRTNQYELYNSLGKKTQLTLIYGLRDALVGAINLEEITTGNLISLNSDHDVTGESKYELLEILTEELKQV